MSRCINIYGQEVYKPVDRAGDCSIDMKALPAGNYVLRVTSPKGKLVYKVIKE